MDLVQQENNLKDIYDYYINNGYNELESIDSEQEFKLLITFFNSIDDLSVEKFIEDNYTSLLKRCIKHNFDSIEKMLIVESAKYYLNDFELNPLFSSLILKKTSKEIFNDKKRGNSNLLVVSPVVKEKLWKLLKY